MLQFVGRYHVLTGKQNFMDVLGKQFKEVLECQLTKTKIRGLGM